VFYCSPECQRADWKGHKPACKVATAEREASQIVRVGKGGGSAPGAAASPPLLSLDEQDTLVEKWAGAGVSRTKLRAAAVAGDTGAQLVLGFKGAQEGDQRDALKWMGKAAAGGMHQAQYNLGVNLELGMGGPEMLKDVPELFRQAAAQGNGLIMVNLGSLYKRASAACRGISMSLSSGSTRP
jgi:TPR repeat protein